MTDTKLLPWYLLVRTKPWETYHNDTIPVLTIDLETTNLEKGDPRNPDNHIVKIATKLNEGQVTSDPYRAFDMLEDREGKPTIIVCHNCKFELGWLNREGFDTKEWLPFDTIIAEFVIAGNRRWTLDLDSVAQRYRLGSKGRLIDRMMKSGINPSDMPRNLLRERVEWDVNKTYELFKKQREILIRDELIKVAFTRMIFTPVLARMETQGMTLDPDRVREEYDKLVKRRIELLAELQDIAKGKKLKGPQLAKLVYEDLGFEELRDRNGPRRTATGRPLTDTDTLEALVARTHEQKRFIKVYKEFNKIDSAISKYMAFYMGVVNEKGGTFYANFNQTRVRTHRLSSSGKKINFADGKSRSVQFHNQPREYKRLFRVLTGRKFSEADGSQLEFRVGGSVSLDPQVLHDVTTGADIHRYTASVMYGTPEDNVTKEQRDHRKTKANTFKPMYGGQRGTKKEMAYYEAFRNKYRRMYDTQMSWVHTVLKDRKLRIASGLIFYWPDTRMQKSGYITNTPSIFDYPIQSLATADIIPIAVTYLYWSILAEGIDAVLLNTVHDSVEADVADEALDKYHELVVESFLDRVYNYLEWVYGLDLYVPLGVAYKAGTYWGEGTETKVSYSQKHNRGHNES